MGKGLSKVLGKLLDENPSGEQDAMKEVEPSGEQDAMKEVSGTEKGLVSNIKKAANFAKKVIKKDHEHYQKQKHHPKDWHKWLPGNNPFYDENPSGEQDAMKEVEPSGEQDAMNEVSGTEKGLLENFEKAAVKGVTEAAKIATKVVKKDQEHYRKQKHHPKD